MLAHRGDVVVLSVVALVASLIASGAVAAAAGVTPVVAIAVTHAIARRRALRGEPPIKPLGLLRLDVAIHGENANHQLLVSRDDEGACISFPDARGDEASVV